MKAAYINEKGPAENIIYGDLPIPEPKASQILVKVGAASLNPVDTYVRSGMIDMELPEPFIVGCDFAGRVESVGPEVSRFKPGDRVWGSNQGLLGRQGTFAEYVATDECWAYPTPENVSDEEAAAISLVGITAHLGLCRDAKLQSGESIAIRGGSGGVGSTVLQMAKAIGAKVFSTAGSDEKAQVCRDLGADAVINYQTQDVAAEIKKLAPAGVNVWWETAMEPDFDLAIGALTSRGRMIVMAGRDARPPFPVGQFYVKGCSLYGFVMFLATPDEQQRAAEDINRWLAAGQIKPRIDRVLSLSEAANAHKLQEENTVKRAGTIAGKILVKP